MSEITTPLTAETLAYILNGNEYTNEISHDIERQAKASGLVVVFGGSDDLIEFRGAIHDEAGAGDGTIVNVDEKGILSGFEKIEHEYDALKDFFAREGKTAAIKALWCREGGYSWTYETAIPHATFEIVEDKEPFCRGFVFALADIKPA